MNNDAINTGALMYIKDRPPLVMVRGQGAWLWDHNGKAYLDFIQGWAVNCLGHSPAVVVEAIQRQAATLLNPSPDYYNAPMIELANLLVEHSAFERVFSPIAVQRRMKGRSSWRGSGGNCRKTALMRSSR